MDILKSRIREEIKQIFLAELKKLDGPVRKTCQTIFPSRNRNNDYITTITYISTTSLQTKGDSFVEFLENIQHLPIQSIKKKYYLYILYQILRLLELNIPIDDINSYIDNHRIPRAILRNLLTQFSPFERQLREQRQKEEQQRLRKVEQQRLREEEQQRLREEEQQRLEQQRRRKEEQQRRRKEEQQHKKKYAAFYLAKSMGFNTTDPKFSEIVRSIEQSKKIDNMIKLSTQLRSVEVPESIVLNDHRLNCRSIQKKDRYTLYNILKIWNVPTYNLSDIPFTPDEQKRFITQSCTSARSSCGVAQSKTARNYGGGGGGGGGGGKCVTSSDDDQFFVLYHGTSEDFGKQMSSRGASVDKTKVGLYGDGFYVTPSISEASSYGRNKSGTKYSILQYLISVSVAKNMKGKPGVSGQQCSLRGVDFTFAEISPYIIIKNSVDLYIHRLITVKRI